MTRAFVRALTLAALSLSATLPAHATSDNGLRAEVLVCGSLATEYSHLGNSEASYLLAQWLTSPENLKEGILDLTGNTDPIRVSNFEDPDIQNGLPGGDLFVAAMKDNLAQAWPDLIIPGSAEYSQILEIKLQDYLSGNIDSAQEALDQAAEEWDKVTEKLGKDRQKEYYQAFSNAFFGSE